MCTTELGYMAGLKPEFDKRNTKVIGLSIDSVEDHDAWLSDIEETQGHAVNYPLIGDTNLEVAKLYDMIHPNASGAAKSRPQRITPRYVRCSSLARDKLIKLIITYPMSTGRNFDEVLRVLDSIQLTARQQSGDPGQLAPGRGCDHVPAVSNEACQGEISERLEGAEALSENRAAAE